MKDFEKLLDDFKREAQGKPKKSHIRIEMPDGEVLENDAELWCFAGIDPQRGATIKWANVEAIGGFGKMLDVIHLLAVMSCECESLSAHLVEAIPGMTNEKLYELVRDGMTQIKGTEAQK